MIGLDASVPFPPQRCTLSHCIPFVIEAEEVKLVELTSSDGWSVVHPGPCIYLSAASNVPELMITVDYFLFVFGFPQQSPFDVAYIRHRDARPNYVTSIRCHVDWRKNQTKRVNR